MKEPIKTYLVLAIYLFIGKAYGQQLECKPVLSYEDSSFANTVARNNSFTDETENAVIPGTNWTAIKTPDIITIPWAGKCSQDVSCEEDELIDILRTDIDVDSNFENHTIENGYVEFDSNIHSKNYKMLGARNGEGISCVVQLNPDSEYLLRFSQTNARRKRPQQYTSSARWVVTLDGVLKGKSIYMPTLEYATPFSWDESLILIKTPPNGDKNDNRILKLEVEDLPHSYINVSSPSGGVARDVFNYMLIDNISLIELGDCEGGGVLTEQNNSSFIPKRSTSAKNFEYFISAWVKEQHGSRPLSYTSNIEITYKPKDGLYIPEEDEVYDAEMVLRPSGAIIDGWQRIEGVFTIPKNAEAINIALVKQEGVGAVYFDDVRIHNAEGHMKSFVYDPVTQRLMAELDENNYATLYEYDNQGGLVRVKKETEKGIYTIQETRSGNSKLNIQQ